MGPETFMLDYDKEDIMGKLNILGDLKFVTI